jgi:AraC family transcriptional regulator of adaptative response/methylated-DNA-[protein]-cysteine methyltransferase
MTPIDQGNELRFAVGETSLGPILVASSDKGIRAILFGSGSDGLLLDLQKEFPDTNLVAGDGDYGDVVAKVVRLVEAPASDVDLPLDIGGTDFQQHVWQAIREIPAGATASYTDIAKKIGSPEAVRAVGQACGANKLAVAIPCHRVVKADGSLFGYRWGDERKRILLEREAKA